MSSKQYNVGERVGKCRDLNNYAYVGGNPVAYIDSDGLNPLLALYRAGAAGYRAGEAINPYIQPGIARAIDSVMLSSRRPGYWDGPAGAVEWGRRNGVDPREAKNRFHRGVKQGSGLRGDDECSVNPDTGDIADPNGESIGDMGSGSNG